MQLAVPFNDLPDNARVRIPVALSVSGLARTTLYNQIAAGRFPRIEKIHNSRTSVIRVGELRRYLENPAAYRAEPESEVRRACAA